MHDPIDCPSSRPERKGSRIFGVMKGPEEERRVGYLSQTLPPDQDVFDLFRVEEPTERFRIAAPCANSGCKHFDGSCTLAQRIVAMLPPVTDALPACQIRATCRWFVQEGGEACLRCPQVATLPTDPKVIAVCNG